VNETVLRLTNDLSALHWLAFLTASYHGKDPEQEVNEERGLIAKSKAIGECRK
jgi:hypothetical protein